MSHTKNNLFIKLFLKILCSSCLFILFFPNFSSAQTKSYNYDSIKVKIQINKDSTFDVTERQTFNFTGSFHEAWRVIPFNKISAITDIKVFDGETGEKLSYSRKRLNKLNPSSWGKYTYNRSSGNQNIIWYYNLSNTQHEWIIKYKIHGGISFLAPYDRLYWNILTDYSVPIENLKVDVYLPETISKENAKIHYYRSYPNISNYDTDSFDDNVYHFEAFNIKPKEAYTIDIAWPKGVVSKFAWWLDFFKLYYGYIVSFIALISALIYAFVYWIFTEKLKKGRGTIIPQYAPPKNLRPAMAEVICKERITSKGFAATIIDLAVRGYVKIEEDRNSIFYKLKRFFNKRDYKVLKNKPFENDSELENYEKKYLKLLFGPKDYFSTRELKKSSQIKRKEFYEEILKLTQKIYEETELDTHAFEKGISLEKRRGKIIGSILTIVFLIIYFTLEFNFNFFPNQLFILVMVLLLIGICLWLFIKYEARLSKEGLILKEEWLGFKMYLEVAERYRMQNLTPDIFEKYLPYAMIFGVEKKWAKAFDSIVLEPPSWYVGATYGNISASSFSPSSFSASFSSSFTSSFSSSGGAGGVGGGGAGGGGGGGGGGAS